MFTLVIATCDRPDRLSRLLRRLERVVAESGERHRVIVVDNGFAHPVQELVDEFRTAAGHPVDCLRSEPGSKAAALNAGIEAADTEWLGFTDDDTLPREDWLKQAAAYRDREDCRMFGGLVEPGLPSAPLPRWLVPGRSGRVARLGGVLVQYKPREQSGILDRDDPVPFGANVFVSQEVFREHGGYDEALWTLCGKAALGVEDGEFGVRVRDAGERIGYCSEAVVEHPIHYERCTMRSHLKIAYRYGWRDPLVYFRRDSRRLEPYKIRKLAGWIGRLAVDGLRGDTAAAVADLEEVAVWSGRIAGRLSSAHRKRAEMLGTDTEIRPPAVE